MRNKDKKRINRAIEDFKITLKNKEELFNKYAREDFGEYLKEALKENNIMKAVGCRVLAELEQKDKRIQELEEENKRKDMFVEMAKEVIENSILKQTIIDKVKENKQILDRTNDGNLRERLYIENDILQELLEGEKH